MAMHLYDPTLFITPTTATVQVSGVDSEQPNYPFTNAWTEWDKPWFEWRGSDTDDNDHVVTFTFTGTVRGFVILGANFTDITYLGSRTLDKNRRLGDYRFIISYSQSSPLTFTIPAQDTEEGYFKLSSIILLGESTSAVLELDGLSYPASKKLLQPAIEVTNFSGRLIRGKTSRIRHIISLQGKYQAYDKIASINSLKQSLGQNTPTIFYENQSDMGEVYMVRRLNDFQYRESGFKNFSYAIALEELA